MGTGRAGQSIFKCGHWHPFFSFSGAKGGGWGGRSKNWKKIRKTLGTKTTDDPNGKPLQSDRAWGASETEKGI